MSRGTAGAARGPARHHVPRFAALLVGVAALTLAPVLGAQETNSTVVTRDTVRARASLGSPDQVDNQLESDARPKEPLINFGFLDGYFSFKERLKAVSYTHLTLPTNREV